MNDTFSEIKDSLDNPKEVELYNKTFKIIWHEINQAAASMQRDESRSYCAYYNSELRNKLVLSRYDDFKRLIEQNTIRKIHKYGLITGTDTKNIDDMKVMYFAIQSIISVIKEQDEDIPSSCLKMISEIGYRFIRHKTLTSSRCFKDFDLHEPEKISQYCLKKPNYCSLESIVMLKKLDYMYINDFVTIDDMWKMYGKYGTYSVIKTLYLTVYKANFTDERASEKIRSYSFLITALTLLKEGFKLSDELIAGIISNIKVRFNEEYTQTDFDILRYREVCFKLSEKKDIEKMLEHFKGRRYE